MRNLAALMNVFSRGILYYMQKQQDAAGILMKSSR
jgi:hypothetical protein